MSHARVLAEAILLGSRNRQRCNLSVATSFQHQRSEETPVRFLIPHAPAWGDRCTKHPHKLAVWDWRPVSSSVRIGPQLAPEHLPNPVLLTHSRGYPARVIAQTLVWFPLLRLCDTPSFPIDRQPGLPVNPDNPPSHLRRLLQSTLVKVSLVQGDVTPCRFRQVVNGITVNPGALSKGFLESHCTTST